MRLLNQYVGRFLAVIFAPFARIWSLMRRFIPGLKNLPTLKPELLSALLCFVLVLGTVVAYFVVVISGNSNEVKSSTYWSEFWPLVLITFMTPVVVYFGVKIFLAPPKSPFPEIDLAFEAGIKALEKNGISLTMTPIYVVLGTPEPKMIKQIAGSSNRKFDFSHVTADGQALHWYGSSDNIYVFLTGVGNICQLTMDLAKYVSQTSPDTEYSGGNFKGTIDVRALGKGKHPSGNPTGESTPGNVSPVSGDGFTATIKVADLGKHVPTPQAEEPSQPKRPANKHQLSSREKLAYQKRRLVHFCELLKRRRSPMSPLNGLLVVMTTRLVEEFPSELARQIKSDLLTICNSTGVISTVTAIVSGFENDQGCREFVSRLREIEGESFLKRRFGKSYRSWECPTHDHLEEIANESIENFDQYIYSIFTQHDALSSRHVVGNRNMVKFLGWIYSRFSQGLEQTLTTGFNVDTERNEDFPRFAGCYFMGVGDEPGAQFFNEGVFDRIDQNQGELEWTSKLIQRDENSQLLSQLVFLVGLIAFGALCVLIYLAPEKSDSSSGDSAHRTTTIASERAY